MLKFYPVYDGQKLKAEYALIQVKGGHVTSDAVRALKTQVEHYGASAGVMVCFKKHMRTVENQRFRGEFSDTFGSYPVIQGFSIEDLLANKKPDLPLYGRERPMSILPRHARTVASEDIPLEQMGFDEYAHEEV